MNTLWVYGCSFSEPFGLLPISKIATILEDGSRNFLDIDYWGSHLARKLNLNIITKSISGVGWNYINNRIDLDIIHWNKNDTIIISPSYFSRITVMEFLDTNSLCAKHSHLLKDINDILLYNEIRWRTKIETLQYLGFNVYTWLVDSTIEQHFNLKNLILTPDGSTNFKDWMDLHKEYWLNPEYDWHFNEKGHMALSEIMYDYIYNK
jgi:hypothetical protein